MYAEFLFQEFATAWANAFKVFDGSFEKIIHPVYRLFNVSIYLFTVS